MPGEGGEVVLSFSLDLHVFYKDTNEWSKPIHGVGGSKLVVKERSGLYTDDEAEKKAYTDAISVACKALGMGANVYWSADRTKYTAPQPAQPQQYEQKYTCERCTLPIHSVPGKGGKELSPVQIVAESKKRFNAIYCADCMRRMMEAQKQREAGN
jgi:ribosomal protein L34E